jgi:microsomal dipeptidase-like Zn-dependent dipeptidase
MIADLHTHYPMHVVPERRSVRELLTSADGHAALFDSVDARVVGLAGRIWNHESLSSGPRVTVDRLLAGDVGVALSVLLAPLLEIGSRRYRWYRRRPPYGGPPEDGNFPVLIRQLELVERHISERHATRTLVAHSPEELHAGIDAGKLVLVHCVEGGFHLGANPTTVDHAVTELAHRGVAYITLAHLYWRHIATNAPAFPFLSDERYHRLWPQPALGLTELGRAAVRAMVREGVLIDITHMSPLAINDTLTLLDELDPDRSVPVIASHAAYRFGTRAYNLDKPTVERIAARHGVIGLILSDHFITDGLLQHSTRSFEESFALLCAHIDRIHHLTGSHRHIGLGSDLDGFVKPTLAGVENSGQLYRLTDALTDRYGNHTAALITSRNALRVLSAHWGRSARPTSKRP